MHSIPLPSPAPRAILRCASALRCIALRSPIHRVLASRSHDSSTGVLAGTATRQALRAGLVLHALLVGVLAAQTPPPDAPRGVARHDSAAATVTPACQSLHPLAHGSPVVPASAVAGAASFVDPSAHVVAPHRIAVGCRSFVAPFVLLDASAGRITIGHESDLQDNVTVRGRGVAIGDRVIVAHGATVVGPAWLGASQGAPAFVGFNAYIDRATVEPDAFVGHLARVGPGVVIHSGVKVLTGKYVRTQAEADDSTLGKVVALTDADREFMRGVLHVNTTLAAGYAALFHVSPTAVHGAGRDPGHSDFNHDADLPRFAGLAESHPEHDRVRIIGAVSLGDGYRAFLARSGRNVAIRADEGEHVSLGRGARLRDRVTLHALEHTDLEIGVRDDFGVHVVVHGGTDDAVEPRAITRVGNDVRVKDWAVVFRSKVGDGCTIGRKAYVDGSHLRPGTVVPDRAILVKDRIVGYVEW
jgi:carbonic anhydrase/acetyltransferase-like protein (isoleucine patch superfamily)